MRSVRLVPFGDIERPLLEAARASIIRELRLPCRDGTRPVDPSFAFHREREQYHSTVILDHLSRITSPDEITVGITAVDLYIPILTFVFGEAQLGGSCAVVSYHRLLQEYYGLPPDSDLAEERLAKEVLHELGHTLGLTHCSDYECAMAASHSVEWLDLKGRSLCWVCRSRITG